MEKLVIKIEGYDIPVFFKDRKSRKTILFVHGFGSSYRFIGNLEELATNYNIVTFSFPGTEDVEANGDVSVELFVKIVNEIINNHIKHSKIYLVGHSLGGLISSEAAQNPRVKKVFFVAPVHPLINGGLLFSKLKTVIEPEGLKQKIASKVIVGSINVVSAFSKTKGAAKKFVDKDSPWYAIVKNTLLDQEYIDKKLRANYLALKHKAYYVSGTLDEVISTSNFVKFVEEELKDKVYLVHSGHHPLQSRTEEVNNFINKHVNFRRRWFSVNKTIVV